MNLRRIKALSWKESLQILRDPSSNIIAFVLPVVLLVIFGSGINLDTSRTNLALVLHDSGPEARDFAASLAAARNLRLITAPDRPQADLWLKAGRVRGILELSGDFSQQLQRPGMATPIQLVTDGTEPNTAHFLEANVRGAWQLWAFDRSARRGEASPQGASAGTGGINVEPRFWFNPSAESRNYLIPGSITIIMTVIGALLTSLVVAREWERGTMEALLASPVTRAEFLLSKLLPYYALGIISLFICVAVAVFILRVPFRGSVLVLWMIGSLFLGSALGFGLLVSTVTRNQFNAAMAALNGAFLPALILSGFIYEIRSMPPVIRGVTWLIPARYFVRAMQTIFQAGEIWSVLLHSLFMLSLASGLFIGITALKTRSRLE